MKIKKNKQKKQKNQTKKTNKQNKQTKKKNKNKQKQTKKQEKQNTKNKIGKTKTLSETQRPPKTQPPTSSSLLFNLFFSPLVFLVPDPTVRFHAAMIQHADLFYYSEPGSTIVHARFFFFFSSSSSSSSS